MAITITPWGTANDYKSSSYLTSGSTILWSSFEVGDVIVVALADDQLTASSAVQCSRDNTNWDSAGNPSVISTASNTGNVICSIGYVVINQTAYDNIEAGSSGTNLYIRQLNNSATASAVAFYHIKGLESSPHDKSGNTTGSGTTHSAGYTGTLSRYTQIVIAAIGSEHKITELAGSWTSGGPYVSGNELSDGTNANGSTANQTIRTAAKTVTWLTGMYGEITSEGSSDYAGCIASFKAELATTESSVTADAYISTGGTTEDSVTADAIIEKSISQSVNAKAVVEKSIPQSVIADALIVKTTSDSITASAVIFKTTEQSITADSVVQKSISQSISADASIVSTVEDSFVIDATIFKSTQQAVSADAIVKKALSGSFSADASISNYIEQDFTADATIKRSTESSFTAGATVTRSIESSISVDAIVAKAFEDSILADATIFKASSGSVAADAIVLASNSGSITANATIVITNPGSITADAVVEKYTTGSVAVDATIVEVGNPVWVSPADTVPISSTPILVFQMPESTGNMHFHMQLDTANTFDTGDLREYKTSESQTNWEYWNGSDWVAVPSGGVSNVYSGNNCRYTVTTPLSATTWYRRVRGGLVP